VILVEVKVKAKLMQGEKVLLKGEGIEALKKIDAFLGK